jgi:hypothetical protein
MNAPEIEHVVSATSEQRFDAKKCPFAIKERGA